MSNVLLYVLTVFIWGTSWFAIEFQLGEVAPTVSVSYRYLLAASLLFGWCVARGLPLGFPARAHGLFVLLGTFIFGLNYIAAYWAQVYISSALNAIVFSSMVWLNILHSRVFFGVHIERRVYLGAALGVAGLTVLFWPQLREARWGDAVATGVAISFCGAVIASWGNMVSQRAQRAGLPVVQSNAWGMLYACLLTALIALLSGDSFSFEFSFDYIASLVYLAVFASIVAFGAYLTLLGRIGAHRSGYAVVVFPIIALLLSVMFEGLELRANVIAGVAMALLGNFLILRRGSGRA